ncbi:MAG: hypothetical protein VKL59_23285 [Nostocaceae cyanobacterium]|nr:hypothetical protein [Nostocaceae cyanobacterium]
MSQAVTSYNEALKTLTPKDFPELHLDVLQDLMRVYLDLGKTAKAEELGRRGTDVLGDLLNNTPSQGKKKQLALKFVSFQQLTVDIAVQSGNLSTALEIAEAGKNACLSDQRRTIKVIALPTLVRYSKKELTADRRGWTLS